MAKQKVKVINGTNEIDLKSRIEAWLDTENPTPVPNLCIDDLPNLRVLFIYSEYFEPDN